MIDCDPHESLDPVKPSFVYLLESTKGNTYIGATIDLNRRLRQHNKEIKGGAYATTIKVAQGETWRRVCYVKGFPDWRAALQFEWRWKQLSRKFSIKLPPLVRRSAALKLLLAFERPTSKAISYKEWAIAPEIVLESDDDKTLFNICDTNQSPINS
jgi:predicted GIY-YIG superfamily endonuclease